MKSSAVRIADAGPRRLIAEHVERREFVGQAGQQIIEHQSDCPCRRLDKRASDGLDQRPHAAAERALDHHHIAGPEPAEQRVAASPSELSA